MQINIQPGNNVSYNFQLPNTKFKWRDGVVLKRIHVQGESFKQRTFKVYFEEEEDEEVIEHLLFDDDQYITQWNTVPPMSSSSLQSGNNVSYNFAMPHRTCKWLDGVLLNRINVQGESFKQRTFKVYFEEEKEIFNLLFNDDEYITQWNTVIPMSSAIRNIQASAAKEIQEIELRYDYNGEQFKQQAIVNLQAAAAKQQAIVNIQAAAAKGIQEEQLKQHPHQTSNKKQKI